MAPAPQDGVDQALAALPKVKILVAETPPDLVPGRFLATMATRVLGDTPVKMHREARKCRAEAAKA